MFRKQEVKTLIIIALPLMAAFLAQRGMQFIDTIMMGWLGPVALAAGALGTSCFATIIIACMGILSAIGVFIVRAKGAGQLSDIKSILQQGLILATLISIPCMLLVWQIPRILLIIGQDYKIVANVSLLLHGLVWGLPGFLFFVVLREFTSAFSLTLIIMILTSISIPLTFAANYVLIYGKYHFPQLGIAGIGYGSAIVMWFMFLSLLVYSKKHPLLKEHLSLIKFKWNPVQLKDLLYIGIPSGVLFLLEAGMFLAATIFMGYFGIAALAAHQIAMQCVNLAYTLPVALSMATALQVGHAAGAQNHSEIRQTAWASFSLVLFVSLIIAILFIYTSDFLIDIFLEEPTDYQHVYQLANSFIHIAALFLCFDALQSVANGALRGLKDTFIPMLISITCYWVLGVYGGYYISMYTSAGPGGVWYGLTLGLSSAAVLLLFRFFRKSGARSQEN